MTKNTFLNLTEKNLNSLGLINKYKDINVSINDNKHIIPLFSYNYNKFLHRIVGININNKYDLIEVLNKKPQSFLTRLRNIVSKFKQYTNLVKKNSLSKRINPKLLVKLTKEEIPRFKQLSIEDKKNSILTVISHKNESQLVNSIDKKYDILQQKINVLTHLLKNNELTIPLHLLNPLLKLKNNISIYKKPNSITKNTLLLSSYLGEENEEDLNLKKLDTNNIKNELEYFVYNKIAILNILKYLHIMQTFQVSPFETLISTSTSTSTSNSNSNSTITNLSKYKLQLTDNLKKIILFNKLNIPIINKFTLLIKNYYKNDIKTIDATQYFELINRYKYVDPFHQNIKFNFNKSNNKKIQNISTLLEYAFKAMSCLISKPVYMETPDKIIINLFYFFIPGKVNNIINKNKKKLPIATSLNGIPIPGNNHNLETNYNKNKSIFKQILTPYNNVILKKLCSVLSNIFNKIVIFDLIALNKPFFDDNILVQVIAILSKKTPALTILDFIYRNSELYSKFTANDKYRYNITKSFLSGIKIKIGGRLMTQKVVPKITSRTIQRGATLKGKVTFVDWSRINLQNKRGAYSITVKMSHVV